MMAAAATTTATTASSSTAAVMGGSSGFHPLDEKSLMEYIKCTPAISSKLSDNLHDLQIKEVGDGNLNFVYIVLGSSSSFVIKQGLPYIRSLGETWPMTQDRSYYEATALKEKRRWCPDHVPEVFHFDREMAVICMRYLEPPHIILRKGLIAGIEYPLLAHHMSEFMSRTLFFTSLLYLTTTEHKRAVAQFCGNIELCRLTEQVVFSDPYNKASTCNRWTSPYLDHDVEELQKDDDLKIEIAELKSLFCERSQALIHGDLHTSSVMVTQDSTQIIDPEFAFVGPIGFDVGAFLGNLFLAYFAQDGHADQENDRKNYKEWILRMVEETWILFHQKFIALWNQHWEGGSGEAYLPEIYNSHELQHLVQTKYMEDLFHDSLGFGAAKMIRRIVGVAHVEDFESIADDRTRADCERRALGFAKMLMKERRRFHAITEVVSAVHKLRP